MEKDYYKILIVGSTGKGKTDCFRDLDEKRTGFINMENKPFPFKNRFVNHVKCTVFTEAYKALIEFGKNPDIESIVLDSFSAYTESLLKEARKSKKGFDIWSMYNDEIGILLDMIKRVPKTVFVTAHYEILGIEGTMEKRVKVKAKEWEGMVEKEFTIVLYADSKFDTKTNKPEYFFNCYQENTSAKVPRMFFGEDLLKIPNDANFILNKMYEFIK